MKFSKNFKKLYDDVTSTFFCHALSTSAVPRDELILLTNMSRAFSDVRFPLSKKDFNSYTSLKISNFSDNRQIIRLTSFYSAVTDFYYIILFYENRISYNKLSRFFMVKNNSSLNFDTLFSSVSQKNNLYISQDVEQYLINILALDIK